MLGLFFFLVPFLCPVLIIIIIKRISRAPIYHTKWQHRALFHCLRALLPEILGFGVTGDISVELHTKNVCRLACFELTSPHLFSTPSSFCRSRKTTSVCLFVLSTSFEGVPRVEFMCLVFTRSLCQVRVSVGDSGLCCRSSTNATTIAVAKITGERGCRVEKVSLASRFFG